MNKVKMPTKVIKSSNKWQNQIAKLRMIRIDSESDMRTVFSGGYDATINYFIKDVEKVLIPIIEDYNSKRIKVMRIYMDIIASFKWELYRLKMDAERFKSKNRKESSK